MEIYIYTTFISSLYKPIPYRSISSSLPIDREANKFGHKAPSQLSSTLLVIL